MRLIEILLCLTLFMILLTAAFEINFQIIAYQTQTLHYMQKTKDVLRKHGELLYYEKEKGNYDAQNTY